MKFAPLLLLVVFAAPAPEIRHFQFQRQVDPMVQASRQSCVAIDPAIFPQASPQLADLRLYRDGVETPYVLHTSTALRQNEQSVALINLGLQASKVVFDADMPAGAYSDLSLSVSGEDFIATVAVSSTSREGAAATDLGEFTIFDFTGQKLGRSTVLHLPSSNFPHLHFRVSGPLHPRDFTALSVARVTSGQPSFQTVAQSSQVSVQGRSSLVEFTVPAKMPVDRITFVPVAQPVNFSRTVTVRVVDEPSHPTTDSEPPQPRTFAGNLLRLHRSEEGHRIDEERLAIEVPAQASMETSKWSIHIENGDDAPVQLSSVRLEALERDLCFDAAPGGQYMLYYGDPALAEPHYDYGDFFHLQPSATRLSAGPERTNARFEPREDERPFTEKHPGLLWVALIAVIVLLGLVAVRSARRGGAGAAPPRA